MLHHVRSKKWDLKFPFSSSGSRDIYTESSMDQSVHTTFRSYSSSAIGHEKLMMLSGGKLSMADKHDPGLPQENAIC